ncbi:MAG: hypothetical protein QW201_01550 [Thermoproteota archaeon]
MPKKGYESVTLKTEDPETLKKKGKALNLGVKELPQMLLKDGPKSLNEGDLRINHGLQRG